MSIVNANGVERNTVPHHLIMIAIPFDVRMCFHGQSIYQIHIFSGGNVPKWNVPLNPIRIVLSSDDCGHVIE